MPFKLSDDTIYLIDALMTEGRWDTLTKDQQRRIIQKSEEMAAKRLNGSVIKVSRWRRLQPYEHYGIYVRTPSSEESVIHYTPEGGGDFKGIIRETSLEEFLDGASPSSLSFCDFNPRQYSHIYSGEETVRRARSKLGTGHYSLFSNNCEHFARWCKTGKRTSSQCTSAMWTLAGLVLVSVVAAFGGPRRD